MPGFYRGAPDESITSFFLPRGPTHCTELAIPSGLRARGICEAMNELADFVDVETSLWIMLEIRALENACAVKIREGEVFCETAKAISAYPRLVGETSRILRALRIYVNRR